VNRDLTQNPLEKVFAMLSHNGEINELNLLNSSTRQGSFENSPERVFVVSEIDLLNSRVRQRPGSKPSRKSLLPGAC